MYTALGIGIGLAVSLSLVVGFKRMVKVDELPTHEIRAQTPPNFFPYVMAFFKPLSLVCLLLIVVVAVWR